MLLTVLVAFLLSSLVAWYMSYWNDSVPTHDSSKRYQERRKRPHEGEFAVVRSFRYKSNALKWIPHCDEFSGTLELVDSKKKRVLFRRECP